MTTAKELEEAMRAALRNAQALADERDQLRAELDRAKEELGETLDAAAAWVIERDALQSQLDAANRLLRSARLGLVDDCQVAGAIDTHIAQSAGQGGGVYADGEMRPSRQLNKERLISATPLTGPNVATLTESEFRAANPQLLPPDNGLLARVNERLEAIQADVAERFVIAHRQLADQEKRIAALTRWAETPRPDPFRAAPQPPEAPRPGDGQR